MLSICSYKPNIKINHFIICMFSILFLSACGLSGDRNGTGGQSASGGSSIGGGRFEDDVFEIKDKIGVRVERINGEVNEVSTNQISIVTLDQNFEEIGSNTLPSYRVEPRLTGGFELQFSSLYTQRLNQVIKVTFSDNPPEILYAPLYKVASDNESITVNSKSHYVLQKLFETVADRPALRQLLPCSNASTDCSNQARAKSDMLKQIDIATQAYNIEINENFTVAQAMNLLDAKLDLRQSVETAVNEISRDVSPFTKATRRSFTLGTDGEVVSNLSIPLSYHSVLFGVSLSDIRPNDLINSVKLSSLISSIVPADSEPDGNDSSLPAYPSFRQSISLLDMRRDVLSSDIPFERTSLDIGQNNTFILRPNEALNSLTANLTDAFLSTEGFLLNERVIQQTIRNTVGWEFSPYFTKSYQVNEYEYPSSVSIINPPAPDYGNAATWLVSSNYIKGASFSLNTSNGSTTRGVQLEDASIFSWEVHGLETAVTDNDEFELSTMDNKAYGAISFSLKLDDQNNNAIQVIAETTRWTISSSESSGTISITQPSSDHFKTLTLARNNLNQSTGLNIATNPINEQLNIARVASLTSKGLSQQGLITIEGSGSGAPQGHASTNGGYMALVFNEQDFNDTESKGQGILLASELVNFNYVFSGEVYQLQGNSFEINSEQNRLHNLNGSSLLIANSDTNDCQAVLSLQRTSVTHTVGSQANTLSTPQESTLADVSSQSCNINGSEIHLEFGQVYGEALTLKGFITQKNTGNEPGNLINFVWQQDSQLGLIFANKTQDLSPTFDD